jgi:hypothetical protein
VVERSKGRHKIILVVEEYEARQCGSRGGEKVHEDEEKAEPCHEWFLSFEKHVAVTRRQMFPDDLRNAVGLSLMSKGEREKRERK